MQAGFDVIVKITQDDHHKMTMTAHYQGEKFAPETVKTHAALEALNRAWPDIVAQVNGQFTDADRFRGLKEFSLLGSSTSADDRARFTVINEQLKVYEEKRGFTEGGRTEQDFIDIANFILHTLEDTKIKLTAPTAKPE